jgi:TPR repeat protein
VWRWLLAIQLLCVETCLGQDFDTGMRAYAENNYVEAVKQWKPLAEQGNANAQLRLGWLYDSGGPGIPADLRESTMWFRKAAEQGIVDAQVIHGIRYETGQGVPVNEHEALRWYRQAADSGDAAGQYDLGILYASGKQIERDYDEALVWIRRSADQGYGDALKELELMRVLGLTSLEDYAALFTRSKVRADRGETNAQFALGLMYDLGLGVTQDWEMAILWYRKAAEKGILPAAKYLAAICKLSKPEEAIRWTKILAEHGEADAAFELAEAYTQGRGVTQNDGEGVKWYLRAGQLGNVLAEAELGMIYGSGRGHVPKNASESVRWFRRAADHGNQFAQVSLGEAYELGDGVAQDYREAMYWYWRADRNTSGGPTTSILCKREAQTRIGLMYFHGFLSDPSKWEIAVRWLLQPAQEGDSRAQFSLAEIYFNGGWGVAANQAEAARWHLAAGGQGNLGSLMRLAEMYAEGIGVEKDTAEARKWNTRIVDQLQPRAEAGDSEAQLALGETLVKIGSATQAVPWFRKAAEQSTDGEAEQYLGGLYDRGDGVPQDYAEAAHWFQLGAEKGGFVCQVMLAQAYALGRGAPQDQVLAYKWYNIAAARNPQVAEMRDGVAATMTPQQVAAAQVLSRQWRSNNAGSNNKPPEQHSQVAPQSKGAREQAARSGSGFLVTYRGDLITNWHVVKGCTAPYSIIGGARLQLTTIALDQQDDLALLRLPTGTGHFAVFSDGQRLVAGRAVVVVGFPLMGLLASGANITTGVVSALAGLGDDARMLQITAPVQPGNSGGPLLDQTGNVVGVVVGKLNALTVARATGDIPQNVNFAIKGSVVRSFLEANGVKYAVAPSNSTFDVAVIAEHATHFTVPIECSK